MQTLTSNGAKYDVSKIILLCAQLPVEDVPLEKLVGELESAAWSDEIDDPENKLPNFSPRDVINHWGEGGKFKYHYDKAMRADLAFPIIVLRQSSLVLDGLHRLTKAYLTGQPTISVIWLDKIPEEARLN